jgi:hypothetical protein
MNQSTLQSWTNLFLSNTFVQQNHQQATKSAGYTTKRKKKSMLINNISKQIMINLTQNSS